MSILYAYPCWANSLKARTNIVCYGKTYFKDSPPRPQSPPKIQSSPYPLPHARYPGHLRAEVSYPVLFLATFINPLFPAASNASSRPSSNFVVDVPTSPSLRAKTSGRPSVTDLFRRTNTHKPAASRDYSETSSIRSGSSNSKFRLPRMLSRYGSSESIATDAMSISSLESPADGPSSVTSPSRMRGRSAANSTSSIRGNAPPSSFHTRAITSEHTPISSNAVFDEENLQTSQQIRNEAASVEAERKRLMDAFNGLELSTLTKRQRQPGIGEDAPGATYTLRRNNILDSDGISVASGSTSASAAKSTFSSRMGLRGQASGSLRTGSIRRQDSFSSMSSSRLKQGGTKSGSGLAPPLPQFSSQLSHEVNQSSNSSLNLGRSSHHLPMLSVPEGEVRSLSSTLHDTELVDGEMEEIRRRREEVSKRYEARLEYLQAKLKGAQLHEKLMKK